MDMFIYNPPTSFVFRMSDKWDVGKNGFKNSLDQHETVARVWKLLCCDSVLTDWHNADECVFVCLGVQL